MLEKLRIHLELNKTFFVRIHLDNFSLKPHELRRFEREWRSIIKNNVKCLLYEKNTENLSSRDEIDQVLRDFHFSPTGGHQGVKRTVERLQQSYHWPGLVKDVKNMIRTCEICNKNKYGKATKMPMQITSTATKPFQRIALDIVGPLPESEDGFKYLLTFQDDLTKFVGAIPIPNQEAQTVAKEFVSHVVLRFGIPDSILTDQGSNFLSDLFTRM